MRWPTLYTSNMLMGWDSLCDIKLLRIAKGEHEEPKEQDTQIKNEKKCYTF